MCLKLTKEIKYSTRSELTEYLGVHKGTIERWLKKYSGNGIAFMVTNQSKHAGSQHITKDIHHDLADKANDSSNSF